MKAPGAYGAFGYFVDGFGREALQGFGSESS